MSEITGPPFCAEAGLVELGHVQAVDQRGDAEDLADRDHAGAADAHHPQRELVAS